MPDFLFAWFPQTTESCQVYSLHEGCYGDESCSGQVTLQGGYVAQSQVPTPAPTPVSTFSCIPYAATETKDDTQSYSTCRYIDSRLSLSSIVHYFLSCLLAYSCD